MQSICDDLAAEHADLDRVVGGIDDAMWDVPTPAVGWAVRDQISHLWFFDQRALLALTDAESFAADARAMLASGGVEQSVAPGRVMAPSALLAAWRRDRDELLAVARRVDASTRVPWYGPTMGARSFVTARLMETWAHGQDVVDALGASRVATPRLKHVAHLGVRARPFSYAINGMQLPERAVTVRLRGPDGDEWVWDEGSDDQVTGDALDFCLVVTQRRHVADTSLRVDGPLAEEWIGIAQAFAGEPGSGRRPGQFP